MERNPREYTAQSEAVAERRAGAEMGTNAQPQANRSGARSADSRPGWRPGQSSDRAKSRDEVGCTSDEISALERVALLSGARRAIRCWKFQVSPTVLPL